MPSQQLTIRAAGAEDVDQLVRLINAAFVVERFFIDRDRTDAEGVRTLMATGAFLVGADETDRLVACVYVERRGARGYLGVLSVDPERQGRGFGRALAEAAEEYCKAGGCTAMDIRVVNLRQELPPFYRRLGYGEYGTAPFEDPRATRPCHFILMSREL
jgi:GNAT superfamily N-acetyltransferase